MPLFFRTDDPIADFHAHDADQEEALKKCPICCKCGDEGYIQDDFYYLIEGDIYCEEHMEEYIKKNFRKWVEDYI